MHYLIYKNAIVIGQRLFCMTKVCLFFLSANGVVDQQGYAIYFFAFKDIYHLIDLHFIQPLTKSNILKKYIESLRFCDIISLKGNIFRHISEGQIVFANRL